MDMSDTDIEAVEVERRGDRATATMVRHFEDPPAELWVALSDPGVRVNWLAPGEIDLRVGGRARLDFIDSGLVIDSEVTACDPGRVLEFSWGTPKDPLRPVRFEIAAADDGGADMTVTLDMPADDDVGRSCAGWSAHLEMLAATLAGAPIKFPFERFKAARDTYRARFAAG
jgi:uncharacterized protein YndB with AHSA1/START domain